MKIFRILTILLLTLPILVFSKEKLAPTDKTKAKNIIILIGDGMGLAQTYAAYSTNNFFLNMYLMPYMGISITYSADNYITDSAAGGTAIATGNKTNNGAIAKDTTGKNLETILEIAKKNKLATGLISTSAITHATPASFVAHVSSRQLQDSIANYFLDEKVDLFIGGGMKYFNNRKDKRNLVQELKDKGYSMFTQLDSASVVNSEKAGFLLADDGMPKMSEGRGSMLPDATRYAIEKLKKNDNGFFLMVEGSQIDWGSHYNKINYVLGETLDFDKAIGEALKFAAADGNTLVIVTADHETGGLTLTGGNMKGDIISEFSSIKHTAVPVLIFSYGPYSQNITGVMDNTMIFQKMLEAYGFKK